MNVNQQALLELIKATLFTGEPSFPENTDWNAVMKEAENQAVTALAAPSVPEYEAERWQDYAGENKLRFLRILSEQTNLVQSFDSAGIPIVILKGCAAAIYYPEPIQRTMGDIDFVVPPERFEDSRRLMADMGYEFVCDYGDDREYVYRKGEIILELHRRYSDKKWEIDPLILAGLAHPIMCELYDNAFPTLPRDINGLVLIDHIRHHLDGGIGIRQVIDWMMFVHGYLDDETWKNGFAPLARDAGLELFAITLTKMCRLWLGLPDNISWCDSADETTARQLLDTFFDYGNFGVKKPYVYRPMENVSFAVRRQGFFRFLQSTGIRNWETCRKYSCLRPFAWLYQLFRFSGRGIKAVFNGEHLAEDAAKGAKKSDFYDRLGLNR